MSISSSGALATPLIPSAFSGTQSRDAEGRVETGRLNQLATGRSIDIDKARDKTEALEGVFLSRLMSTMLEGIDLMPGMGDGAGARAAEDFQKSMLAEKTGQAMAQVGGIGLSAEVLDQLIRIQEAQS
ncbi:rod-binding protein [Tistrella mobilis]|uniref:hypothetical protein n=1 Tax=Tistrella mobilis TaxID=171437 RepID=UPI00355688CB